MPRCLSEGVDIFLKSVERQGESEHDVRVSQAMLAWLLDAMDGVNRTFKASGRCHGWQLEPCPYGLEPLYHFS